MLSSNSSQGDNQPPLRIVIADDHALVRGGIALLVEMASPGVEVLHANSFDQVLSTFSENDSIDLMLLDLKMPGMDPDSGIRTICRTWPEVPIIIVSVTEDVQTIRKALAAGAMGYVPKTSSPDVTISALKLVLAGGIYVPPHVLKQDISQLSNEPQLEESGTKSLLTRRQMEVLDLIVSGKSNKAIADEIGLTTSTVKMHVSGIFKKLGVGSRTEAIAKHAELNKNYATEK
ncbi:MAG: response regulator transcription factor [Pseudomonadales bacterium]